jgi:hypothetical protein
MSQVGPMRRQIPLMAGRHCLGQRTACQIRRAMTARNQFKMATTSTLMGRRTLQPLVLLPTRCNKLQLLMGRESTSLLQHSMSHG